MSDALPPDHRRIVLAEAARYLENSDTPDLDARVLLADVMGVEPQGLLLLSIIPPEHLDRYEQMIERRRAGEPVGRILGKRGFWTLDIGLNEATLEPRPDSETLVEAALKRLPEDRPTRILDLGTGSGCLLLAILSERPLAHGVGVDAAPLAVRQAGFNAFSNDLSQRAEFRLGDWVEGLDGPFDLAVANPPYIPSGDIPALMAEVREHDPMAALDGGPDGLSAYRRIAETAARVMTPGAPLLLELGAGQAADVSAIFEGEGWIVEGVLPDLGGVDRCLIVRSPAG